jgi:ATP-binding cassette subfamily B protein
MTQREFSVDNAHRYDYRSPLRWIFSHMRRFLWLLVLVILVTVSGPVLYSQTALLVGRAIDLVAAHPQDTSGLLGVALIILALRLFQGAVSLGRHLFTEMLSQRLQRDIRDELYVNLLGKSQTFHNRQQVGDIMARATNDVRQIGTMINPGFGQIFLSVVYVIVAVVAIGSINISLLLMPLIFGVLFPPLLRRFGQKLGPLVGDLRKQFGLMNASLAEAIGGIEVVKAAAQEQAEQRRFNAQAEGYRDLGIRQGAVQARYLPLLLLAIFYALGFGHALFLWRRGILSVGQVVAFMGLFDLLRLPTTLSLFSFTAVQLGLASAGRILGLITAETELDENVKGRSQPIQGTITFENVSFGYDDQLVLHNISFQAQAGETIAIVGQTGAGKSTLTRLVNRTYDATSGRVLVDGLPVGDWSLQTLRSQISTIEQDIFLFSRTIAENIAFGAGGHASMEQIEDAARQAQAHDFIMSFPQGYETLVGERGLMLSGGQRQRIAIARAFLTNPRILILDDSTSAIDSATEDQIQQAMRRILNGRTTLLITHRLAQIRWADRILFLQHGQLVDQGTHTDLLARNADYSRIFMRYYRAADLNLPTKVAVQ